jgi:hypothetical protein
MTKPTSSQPTCVCNPTQVVYSTQVAHTSVTPAPAKAEKSTFEKVATKAAVSVAVAIATGGLLS